jgi:hypothetical protein
MHGLPVKLTLQTLSYYITFQNFFINPKLVDSYLSSICNQLKLFFSDIQKNCASSLVTHTLAGAKQYHGTATIQKSPFTIANLLFIYHDLVPSTNYDNLLFNAQLNTGFTALLCLGELTWPNNMPGSLNIFTTISELIL